MEEVVLKVKVEGSGDSEAKVKSIKQQLREAKEAALQAKEGTEEYFQALNKAAGLADKLQDVNKAVNQLDPSAKAQAFGTLINSVAGGFQTITGLYGLLGQKSEDVEKLLLRVQAASALAMGVQSLVEAGKQWNVLKNVIVSTLNSLKIGMGTATAGISLAIGALAIFKDELFATAEAEEDVKDYMDSANKSAAEQLVKVQSLVIVAKDQNRTLQDRNNAIKQLNEISPKYLGNLTLETIGTEAATTAVNNYTNAILKNAKAQAAKDKLIDLQKQILDAEQNDKIAKALFEGQQRLNLGITESEQKFRQANGTLETFRDTSSRLALEQKRLLDIVAENSDIEDKSISVTRNKTEALNDLAYSYISIAEELDRLNLTPPDQTIKAIDDTDNLLMVYDNYWKQQIDGADNAAKEIAAISDIQSKTEIAQAEAVRNAKISIAQSTIAGLSSLGDILIKDGKKATIFQKGIALAQIAIDTAKAISGLTAASNTNPLNGPTGGIAGIAQFATGIAQILANVAQAKKILSGGDVSKVTGGGGGGTNVNMPSGSGITPPSLQPVNTSGFIQQDEQNFKVYVVESDITNSQQGVQQNKKKALLTI